MPSPNASGLPVCGDEDCTSPSCQPAALDAYLDEIERNTQELLDALARQEVQP